MSLDQLRSFVTVAEERHVGRAARRLCLTQPPVSRHILRLEDELGTSLFERRRDGMALSDAGARLLPVALDILRLVDTVPDVARDQSAAPPTPTASSARCIRRMQPRRDGPEAPVAPPRG